MSNRRDSLVARREAVGHTQESLADRVGVDRSTIVRWERGGRLQPWHRRKLAVALDISLEALDKLLDPAPAPDDVHDSTELKKPEDRREASGPQGVRIAICGSRNVDTNSDAIDAAVAALARFVMLSELQVNHGPVGVGIEVMTYIADRYRPAEFTMTRSLFGRRNIVLDAEYALVVGGGAGTADELDLAVSMGVKVLPYPHSRGTAARFYQEARQNPRLRSWMPDETFHALNTCTDAEEFVQLARKLISEEGGAATS